MKLFSFLIGSLAARKTVKYRDVMTAHKEGKQVHWDRDNTILPNFVEYSNCPALPVTGNIDSWNCNDENCVVVCKSNSSPMPNGSNTNGGSVVRCKKANLKKGQPAPYWNKDAPICSSCDDTNLDAEPIITDSNIDMICHIGLKNMKECFLSCTNGGKIAGKAKMTTKCYCNRPDSSQAVL